MPYCRLLLLMLLGLLPSAMPIADDYSWLDNPQLVIVSAELEPDTRMLHIRGEHFGTVRLPSLDLMEHPSQAADFLSQPAHGLSEAEQSEIAETTLAVLSNTDFAAVFGPGSRAEVPVTGVLDGQVVSGRVDRLVVTDTEVVVVDFKTNRPAPVSETGVPLTYRKQMEAYRALLAQIFPGRSIRTAILWTDAPMLMEI